MQINRTILLLFIRYQATVASFICLGIMVFFMASPATADSIKIGAIFALSGKAIQSNRPCVLGVQLAVQEINLMGGVLGKKLELLLLDNDSTPIGSHVAAETAADAGVVAIIGSVWSSHSLAIAKVAEKHKIPMISPISTVPALTSIGDHIFRVCYDDNFQGKMIAEFAFKEQKARTALVFVDISSDFSLDIAGIFTKTFQSLGGEIVKEIEYKTGQVDFQPQIRQALAHDADIVFLSGHDESGYIADELQEAGAKAIPMGSDSWDVESFFTLGGNKIKRGYFINHWTPAQTDPLSQSFLKRYKKEGEINAGTALSYDAVHVLIAAIEKAGSTDSTAIRSALHKLQGFRGVTGEISFDAEGNAKKQASVIEIREGVPRLLKKPNL
jgi:branched-chain amino acid transport system substrate-binding protein